MKKKKLLNAIMICMLFFGIQGCSSDQKVLIIDDANGVLGESNAPVSLEVQLNKNQLTAAEEGRLGLLDLSSDSKMEHPIPVQLEGSGEGTNSQLVLMMPDGAPGSRKFKLLESKTPFEALVSEKDSKGQLIISEGEKTILQYNYQIINRKDVVRAEKEKKEEYERNERDTFTVTSIYAVPRSNYIHPLYGLEGEMLTRDWPSQGHPHHRAIFWAWPEMYYGKELGDIYALQKVFARPTGNIEVINGPVYSQITAENLWMWEDKEAIVNESACIRVYQSSTTSRVIDLTIEFLALKDSVTLATRYTDSYGGLNIRMQTPEEQSISFFTDEKDADPLRGWSDFNGTFEGNQHKSGLMVLQDKNNPEYPGTWVEYPDLAWVQPTFPTPGTRYALSKTEPLILSYRLIVYKGEQPDENLSSARWDAYNTSTSETK